MRIPQQRVLVTVSATVIAAACGTLAGYGVGRVLTLRHAEARLAEYATRVRAEGEGSSSEARKILTAFNQSQAAYCSDAEIAQFRKLIFQSEYLKDGGRMRQGRIDCSASLGRIVQPGAQFNPDLNEADGTKIYRNLPPFQIAGQTVITLGMGDSFVVYNPYNLKGLEAPSMHFTVSGRDTSSGQVGRLLGGETEAQAAILTTEGEFHEGSNLYATRCSIRHSACMTAYISVEKALEANRSEFRTFIALSGLAGALVGLVGSLVYRRNKGIEQQLRRAIRRDALLVVYQPIVELAGQSTVGAEALARWTDEGGLAVGPDVFVRVAEERGFVGAITELVVRHALESFGETLRNRPDFRLSINIAAADLKDPAFLPMLDRSTQRAKIPAQSLALEITESSTALHETAMKTIHELRKRGHSVHIDDFGTGYSSLSYLHDLSVDAIKIDRSFTRAIGTEAVTLAILPQIVSLAAALKLQVIVEGIETQQQANYFAATDLPILGQGWLFGRPVDAESFLRALAEDKREVAEVSAATTGA
jgi:sensor c-di-GMP phosphodiesterase-like protein